MADGRSAPGNSKTSGRPVRPGCGAGIFRIGTLAGSTGKPLEVKARVAPMKCRAQLWAICASNNTVKIPMNNSNVTRPNEAAQIDLLATDYNAGNLNRRDFLARLAVV